VKTETLIIVGALGLIALYVVLQRNGLASLLPNAIDPRAADERRLKSIIGVLPPDPRFLPKQDKLGAGAGAQLGLQSASSVAPFAGPYAPVVLGVGAAGGAIASLFID